MSTHAWILIYFSLIYPDERCSCKARKEFFLQKKKNKNVQSGDRKTSKTLKIKSRRKAPRQLSEGRGEEREARERRAGDALPSHHHNPPSPNGRRGRSGGDSAEIEIKRLTRCEGEIGGVMEAGDGLKELIEWMKGRGGG